MYRLHVVRMFLQVLHSYPWKDCRQCSYLNLGDCMIPVPHNQWIIWNFADFHFFSIYNENPSPQLDVVIGCVQTRMAEWNSSSPINVLAAMIPGHTCCASIALIRCLRSHVMLRHSYYNVLFLTSWDDHVFLGINAMYHLLGRLAN